MAQQSKLTFDLGKLEDLRKKLGSGMYARVGILGSDSSKTEPGSDLTMSELGLIQLVGSVANNIRARNWLDMPIRLKKKDLVKSLGSKLVKDKIAKGDIKGVFKIIGIAATAIIQEAFETGGFGLWPPNAPITINGGWMKRKDNGKSFFIKGKGSSAPLIDTGEFRRSITSDVVVK